MKILMVGKRAPFDGRGAERVLWRIGKKLAHVGHDITIFCPEPVTDTTVPNVDNISFWFQETSDGATRSQIEFFVRAPTTYRKVYKTVQPDLVYDNPSPFPFHMAHFYGDAPVASKVHAIYRRDALACKYHWLVKIGTIVGEETYRTFRNECFITNSTSTKQRLASIVNENKNRVETNPIGIDVDAFEFNHPRDSKHVLALSKLTPRKGVDLLLQAWQSIECSYPEAKLTIAGSGPQEEELHDLASELGLSSVTFEGYVSERRKLELLSSAQIYVLPTRFEGLGLSNLEAMASGCAIISTNTWGVRDYLEDRVNGLAVDPDNEAALRSAIVELFENVEFASELATRGAETVERYSLERALQQEVEILQDFVS